MDKIVALFAEYETAQAASHELVKENMADYRLFQLGADYEQQIRQEVFLGSREIRTTILGMALGALAGAVLFYYLAYSGSLAILLGRFMSAGRPAAVVAGTLIGLALGGLLAGAYSLSRTLSGNHSGHWLLVLYCDQLGQEKTARSIIESRGGFSPDL